jgi:hypothetical protein
MKIFKLNQGINMPFYKLFQKSNRIFSTAIILLEYYFAQISEIEPEKEF